MIPVAEAKKRVEKALRPMMVESVKLDQALSRVLARDLRSPSDFPLYSVSAMDGFALQTLSARACGKGGLAIQGTQVAGDAACRLAKGKVMRIMTGALVPKGADAVIPKEELLERDGRVFGRGLAEVEAGDHIRHKAEEIRRGDKVAQGPLVLNSRWIGFLSNLGIRRVPVFKRPKVALIVNGSELAEEGQVAADGKIYDSNTPLLMAALQELGIAPVKILRVKDDARLLEKAARACLPLCDLLLLVGGVSVGDFDFSKPVLKRLAVKTIFWGVAQKPGFPLFFGRKAKKLVFGLPGNPVSAWVCFDQYVKPALLGMQGLEARSGFKARLAYELKGSLKKTLFLKAVLENQGKAWQTKALDGQQSHQLGSLARANCLIILPPGGRYAKGSLVEVMELP